VAVQQRQGERGSDDEGDWGCNEHTSASVSVLIQCTTNGTVCLRCVRAVVWCLCLLLCRLFVFAVSAARRPRGAQLSATAAEAGRSRRWNDACMERPVCVLSIPAVRACLSLRQCRRRRACRSLTAVGFPSVCLSSSAPSSDAMSFLKGIFGKDKPMPAPTSAGECACPANAAAGPAACTSALGQPHRPDERMLAQRSPETRDGMLCATHLPQAKPLRLHIPSPLASPLRMPLLLPSRTATAVRPRRMTNSRHTRTHTRPHRSMPLHLHHNLQRGVAWTILISSTDCH
jgi:hypothetical protein